MTKNQAPTALISVALPRGVRRLFDYLAPPGPLPAVGSRVTVPFGAGDKSLVGLVVAHPRHTDVPPAKLKRALAVLDQQALLSAADLKLMQWCADYYHHPLGEVVAAALPQPLRRGLPLPPAAHGYALTREGEGLSGQAFKRAPRRAALLDWLRQYPGADRAALRAAELDLSTLKPLLAAGLIAEVTAAPVRHAQLRETPLPPGPEQAAALAALRLDEFGIYLLEGATGSGKTEVYLQAIAEVLARGRQALVLVPEIGLTPQTLSRFEARFATRVVALHSNVAVVERCRNWAAALRGEARIVVGTRLAVFAPLPELGIIVLDEEHDLSFKQQDGLRYNARDVAAVRAQQRQVPLLLGTATPALETLANAIGGRFEHLRLTQRAGSARAPSVELIDMRERPPQQHLSEEAEQALAATVARGEQALVFLNRRGFAPALTCGTCGFAAECRDCSAKLTLHNQPRRLCCHHCGATSRLPPRCPSCGSHALDAAGAGTERLEAELAVALPGVRISRVDQDAMARKGTLAALAQELSAGRPHILVGTQMLAKGHHFPNMTLAVLADVDQGLYSGDFRGLERLCQQVVQVSGRVGRGDAPGKVLLQTRAPDHPLLTRLLDWGYHRTARALLKERQSTQMPPYLHLAMFRAEAKQYADADHFLRELLEFAKSRQPPSLNCAYLGPVPALLERKADRFRLQLQIKCGERTKLHQLLNQLLDFIEAKRSIGNVRWSVDVDPQDMA